MAGGTDFKPTDTEVELTGQLEQQLTKAEGDYKNLMEKEVPAFNKTLMEHKVTPIVATGEPPATEARPAEE